VLRAESGEDGEEHEQGENGERPRRGRALRHGGEGATGDDGRPRRADENGVERHHHTQGHARPRQLVEQVGGDGDDRVGGAAHVARLGELFGRQPDGDAARDQQEHATHGERHTHVAECDATVTRQPDGQGVESDHHDEEVHTHHVDNGDDPLHGVEFVGFEHDERARFLGDPFEHPIGQTESFSQPGDEHPGVEHDGAVGGADRVGGLVAQDRHEPAVGPLVQLRPRGGHRRRRQQPIGDTDGVALHGGGQRAGQAADGVGEQFPEGAGDVDLAEQLGHQERGERLADVLVVEEAVGHLHPLVGLQHLAVEPRVQRGAHRHRGGHHDQQPHHPPGCPGAPGRRHVAQLMYRAVSPWRR